MLVLPITTGVLHLGDDLADAIERASKLRDGDIVVVSSKVIAMTEGGEVSLDDVEVSEEARRLAKECAQDPRFTAFVLEETKRLNGSVVAASPHAVLTSLKPGGMTGRILCPNAGADRSNVGRDGVIGWPKDTLVSGERLQTALSKKGRRVAVIVSDSCCHPGRLGVTAFALTVTGMDPVLSERGNLDLFGSPLLITNEARADQLATAGNAVMGNAAQATPAAIIRDHGLPFSSFSGWVPGIDPKDDLFRGTILA